MPNDKEHGFCLVTLAQFHTILMQSISNDSYRVVPLPPIRSTNEAYQRLARRIADYEHMPQLLGSICQSLRGDRLCKLSLMVKTHKCLGEMTMRNLHKVSANGYAYAGLASWNFQKLDPVITSLPTLVPDSIALEDRISGLRVPEGSVMYLLDVKDCFRSGNSFNLAGDVADQLDNSMLARLVKDAWFFYWTTNSLIRYPTMSWGIF